MVTISECTKHIPCYDCDSKECVFAGKKEPVCPYYRCPYPGLDCETECGFIDHFIEKMRAYKGD